MERSIWKANLAKNPYLSIEEEEELVSFLLKCAEIGYAHTRPQVLSLVQRIVESKDISEHVSDSWWHRFQERHPILKLRTAMPLSLFCLLTRDIF